MAFRPTGAQFGQKNDLHGVNVSHVERNTTRSSCPNIPTTVSCGATRARGASVKCPLNYLSPAERRLIVPWRCLSIRLFCCTHVHEMAVRAYHDDREDDPDHNQYHIQHEEIRHRQRQEPHSDEHGQRSYAIADADEKREYWRETCREFIEQAHDVIELEA